MRTSFHSLFLTISMAANLWAQDTQPGIVSSEFIFETAPFASCHASTIVGTKDGMVSAWFGGTKEAAPDVGIWLSRQIDGKWTTPVEVANGVQADGKRFACFNPVLFQPPHGPLLLFYKVGGAPKGWRGWRKTSEDNGKTWSSAVQLPDPLIGPVKNKPVILSDGSLLSGSSTEHDGWRVHFEHSTDDGKTWQFIGPVNDGKTINAIQPSILFLGGSKLLAIGRTKESHLFQITSDDNGKTWGPMSLTELPNPNSGTDAVTLKDGRHLLIYNHTAKGRSPLNLALSKDGVHWEAALVLESEPGEYSYPSIIQTGDGLVHIVHTWKRQRIRHWVIDPAKLQTKPIVNGVWPKEKDAYDVVVIGGTPGGIAAAVTAARLGHSTLLVEYHGHLGGMSSGGLGKSDIEHKEVVQGFFREFVDRIVAHYRADPKNLKLCRDGYFYEPSVAEKVFDSFVQEQPLLTVLKNHRLEKAETDQGRITAAVVTDRATGEKCTLRGKVFIDATYEGDVYAAAGAEFRLGRESRSDFGEPHAGQVYLDWRGGKPMSGTGQGDDRLPAYTFRLCLTSDPANAAPLSMPPDYDRSRYLGYLDDLHSGRFGKDANLTRIALSISPLPNHKTDVNMNPRGLGFVFAEENKGYPQGSWEERERIGAHLRSLTLGLLWFLQNDPDVPANASTLARSLHLCRDEFADNDHFPFQLYVREARRLVGEYTLSERNLTEQPGVTSELRHQDAVAIGEFPIDSFPMEKRQPGDDAVLEGYLCMLAQFTRPYQIPYRIMIPKKLDGMIVPVAASTTHIAFSSVRLEPTWMALGQAAGVAAHVAIEKQVQPRQVPIAEVQTILRQQGAVLDLPGDARP